MVWGAAALSLRAASEVIVVIILYNFYNHSVGRVVALHSCLGVYGITTLAIYLNLNKLALVFMVSQHSTITLAGDRCGRELYEESDRDFGEIRLPDYTTDQTTNEHGIV